MSNLTLQHPFSYHPTIFTQISTAIKPERLQRYLRKEAGNTDLQRAFRLYLWNVQLCQAFYPLIHTVEVCIRNGIQTALDAHYGRADWYNFAGFTTLLSANISTEMQSAISKVRRDHGAAMTPNHVVAELPFAFWSHVLTKNFQNVGIWPKKLRIAFPKITPGLQTDRMQYRVELLRDFRNRMAHHQAIYDQQLENIKNTALEVVGWCSPHLRTMLEEIAEFQSITACIGSKPTA